MQKSQYTIADLRYSPHLLNHHKATCNAVVTYAALPMQGAGGRPVQFERLGVKFGVTQVRATVTIFEKNQKNDLTPDLAHS